MWLQYIKEKEVFYMLFNFLKRKLNYLKNNSKHSNNDDYQNQELTFSLDKTITALKDKLGNSPDIIFHPLQFGPQKKIQAQILFIDGLVKFQTITSTLLFPLINWKINDDDLLYKNLIKKIESEVLYSGDTKIIFTIEDIISEALSGNTVIMIDNCNSALALNSKGWEKRSVTEPQSEAVLRGPREGFTENIRTNSSLLRRKIKSENLRLENFVIGEKTRTIVSIMYLNDVVNYEVLQTLKKRIKNINVDSILESGYIEEYIEDAPFSPFPTLAYSEKPDAVAANILEGRIAILVDGTPFVLTVPMLFIESFQSAEDYYGRTVYASLIRILRYIAFLISVFAPAIFIALTTFHQELIPTTLLITILNAREGTAFPIFIEALIMLFAFEIMREAGIRLPRPVGQAISIVGALVMGDAAVSAGLVGAPIVITTAITAVASFLVPNQNEAMSILRIIFIFIAAFVGLFGIVIGFIFVLMHLSSLTSFGIPYFDGFTKYRKDSIVRFPLWDMIKRPEEIAKDNTTRKSFFIPPIEKNKTSKIMPGDDNEEI